MEIFLNNWSWKCSVKGRKSVGVLGYIASNVFILNYFYFSSELFKQKLDSVPDQTSSEEQMENWSKGKDF